MSLDRTENLAIGTEENFSIEEPSVYGYVLIISGFYWDQIYEVFYL